MHNDTFQVGDRVSRLCGNLKSPERKFGLITGMKEGTKAHGFYPQQFYSVIWDDGTTGENYLGSGFTRVFLTNRDIAILAGEL